MKPDWDKLASEYQDSDSVLIADVDCTEGGKDLCETHGVKGYPTIKTFSAGESEGEDYDGGRDFDALKAHAESLGPSCHIDSKEFCSADALVELEKYAAMSKARRDITLPHPTPPYPTLTHPTPPEPTHVQGAPRRQDCQASERDRQAER